VAKGAKDGRLFPELEARGVNNPGALATEWFSTKVVPELKLDDLGDHVSLYSLRHTFASALSSAKAPWDVIADLVGHTKGGETGRYAGRRGECLNFCV
jgi:integrase